MKRTMPGFSLPEILIVLALLALFATYTGTDLMAAQRRRDFENFTRELQTELEKCRWKAMNQRRYAGATIDEWGGIYTMTFYTDGNSNGIRRADIEQGRDQPYGRQIVLQRAGGDIGVGTLDGSDPVRFGRSNIISFSPNGDSSSGTLYLVCRSQNEMYSIVLYGATARMTLKRFSNDQWQTVGDR